MWCKEIIWLLQSNGYLLFAIQRIFLMKFLHSFIYLLLFLRSVSPVKFIFAFRFSSSSFTHFDRISFAINSTVPDSIWLICLSVNKITEFSLFQLSFFFCLENSVLPLRVYFRPQLRPLIPFDVFEIKNN